MKDVPAAQRGAFFICVLVLLRHADDPAPLIAEGRWHGRVLTEERGAHGFGYDPIFIPEGFTQTFGELPTATKHAFSHRGRAARALLERLG